MGKLILMDKESTEKSLIAMDSLGISSHAIDFQVMRSIYAAPTIKDGEACISTAYDKKLLKETIGLIKNRLLRGELTLLTNIDLNNIKLKRFIDLANNTRMKLIVVTEDKEPLHRVKNGPKIISSQEFFNEMKFKVLDFDKYKKVHHFGDLQGCYSQLQAYLKEGIKDDEAYIFLGDLLDRGNENDKVMEFILSNFDRDNFYFTFGNHEAHLIKWVNNQKSNSKEFESRTKKQLETAEISKLETKRLLNKMTYNLLYERAGIVVLASHAGATYIPRVPEIISNDQWMWGGDLDVDLEFQKWARRKSPRSYQVHGHSNPNGIDDYGHSFNLEGKIEETGILRVLTLDGMGFKVIYTETTTS